MWAQVNQILRQAATQIGEHLVSFLPGALVSLLLIASTVVTAALARILVLRALKGLEFDQRVEHSGAGAIIGLSSKSPSQSVARATFWTITLLGLLVSLTALNATIPSQLALAVFQYLPHLLAAALILVIGAMTARFLSRSVLIGAVNMQIQYARILSLAIKWLVQLIAVAMALDHLAIGRSILLLAFGIFFGGIVLAVALAVGLGAKDVVGRALDRQLREPVRTTDKVDHV